MTVSRYFQPASLPEALSLLGEHGPDLLVIAGGTVAMPLINEGISLPTKVMGLRRAGLDGIERRPDGLAIGAMATLTALTTLQEVPLLAEAARHTASWAVRNMGTVGGNLFTPPPGGDVATALLALDAQVELVGPGGARTLPLAAFWTGFMTTGAAPDELVTRILVPVGPGRHAFLKLGRKAANTPAVITVAVSAAMDGDAVRGVRIALGAARPHPLRSAGAEAVIEGQRLTPDVIGAAAAVATEDAEPFSDQVASAWYRRRMVGVVVGRALAQLAQADGRGA
ncbi:MAG TPA: FAD binding domain-containing protein [Candidatus Limnocylindrales bacterium]